MEFAYYSGEFVVSASIEKVNWFSHGHASQNCSRLLPATPAGSTTCLRKKTETHLSVNKKKRKSLSKMVPAFTCNNFAISSFVHKKKKKI